MSFRFSSGSVSTPKERPLGCKEQSTEARAQEDPLLCPQMFSVLFLVVGGGWF